MYVPSKQQKVVFLSINFFSCPSSSIPTLVRQSLHKTFSFQLNIIPFSVKNFLLAFLGKSRLWRHWEVVGDTPLNMSFFYVATNTYLSWWKIWIFGNIVLQMCELDASADTSGESRNQNHSAFYFWRRLLLCKFAQKLHFLRYCWSYLCRWPISYLTLNFVTTSNFTSSSLATFFFLMGW